MNTPAQVVRQLLVGEPWVEIVQEPAVGAYCAQRVVDLWQRLESLSGVQSAPPFWATIWPGALVMCEVLLEQPWLVRQRRAVDVGCGSGVVAIAAAKAGAAEAVANDIDPLAVEAACFNAERNGVVLVPQLGDVSKLDQSRWDAADTLLFSEMFYEGNAAAQMWQWLEGLRTNGVRLLFADAERPFFRSEGLQRLETRVVPASVDLEGVPERAVTVYGVNL